MRKLILTILVIGNVCAGIEVASDYEDAWLELGEFPSIGDSPTVVNNDGEPIEEADCDHCCHGGAHFVGALHTAVGAPFARHASVAVLTDVRYFFATDSPPIPPPIV